MPAAGGWCLSPAASLPPSGASAAAVPALDQGSARYRLSGNGSPRVQPDWSSPPATRPAPGAAGEVAAPGEAEPRPRTREPGQATTRARPAGTRWAALAALAMREGALSRSTSACIAVQRVSAARFSRCSLLISNDCWLTLTLRATRPSTPATITARVSSRNGRRGTRLTGMMARRLARCSRVGGHLGGGGGLRPPGEDRHPGRRSHGDREAGGRLVVAAGGGVQRPLDDAVLEGVVGEHHQPPTGGEQVDGLRQRDP